jgi:ribonuclease P protein component
MALWLAADGPRKVGFAVSRQVRGAVRRNRIRRRLREAFRRHRLALPEGIQVVFIGRAAASSAPFRALVAEMADVVWALAGRVKRGRAGGA